MYNRLVFQFLNFTMEYSKTMKYFFSSFQKIMTSSDDIIDTFEHVRVLGE